jgi:DnaD/phage-associated family protein
MDDARGFPPGELRTTPVPDLFFSHLLPEMSDSAEIKVTLHVFWLCHRRRGRLRAVGQDELLADVTLRRSLTAEDDWQAAALRGLAAAVQRGTLLALQTGERLLYAPNTAGTRTAAARMTAKGNQAAAPPARLPPVTSAPGAATTLYERHIGLVTPMIAVELAEAEKAYPQAWLEDAFAEAARRDKRHWRYVQAILRGWESNGRH